MASVFPKFDRSACRLNPLFGFSSFPPSEVNDAQPCIRLIQYSPEVLLSLRNPSNRSPVEESIYCRIKDCGILKPFQGCRGWKAVQALKDGGSLNIRTRVKNRGINISNLSRSKATSRNLTLLVRHATVPGRQTCRDLGHSVRFCTMNTQSLNNKAATFTEFICDYKWISLQLQKHSFTKMNPRQEYYVLR